MDLQQKVRELYNLLQQKRRIETYLPELKKVIKDQAAHVVDLEEVVSIEEFDVEELKRQNLNTLFYKILGSFEDRLQKETAEYLHAFAEYRAAFEELELLEYEEQVLLKKLASFSDVEASYQLFADQLKIQLQNSGSTKGDMLTFLDRDWEQIESLIEEMTLFSKMIKDVSRLRSESTKPGAGSINLSRFEPAFTYAQWKGDYNRQQIKERLEAMIWQLVAHHKVIYQEPGYNLSNLSSAYRKQFKEARQKMAKNNIYGVFDYPFRELRKATLAEIKSLKKKQVLIRNQQDKLLNEK